MDPLLKWVGPHFQECEAWSFLYKGMKWVQNFFFNERKIIRQHIKLSFSFDLQKAADILFVSISLCQRDIFVRNKTIMSMFFPLIATVEHNEDGDDDGCYKWQSPNDCKSDFIGFTCKIKKIKPKFTSQNFLKYIDQFKHQLTLLFSHQCPLNVPQQYQA